MVKLEDTRRIQLQSAFDAAPAPESIVRTGNGDNISLSAAARQLVDQRKTATMKPKPHLRVRLDADRIALLEAAAKRNGRTLTGEIVSRLDYSFQREDTITKLDMLADRVVAKLNNFK